MQRSNIYQVLFFILMFCPPMTLWAQVSGITDFESPVLPPNSYLDGSDLTFTEFNGDCAIFKTTYVVDTVFGFNYFARDFARSNMKDTVDGSFLNLFSVISGSGANGSAQYAIGTQNYEGGARIIKDPSCIGSKAFLGFYVNNTTYAYKSMLYGDQFAKKFGGVSGDDPDYFVLTIKGYSFGTVIPDSVNFYLADYRQADNSLDYIINEWSWVDLYSTAITMADSLEFILSSSDNSQFGMNTPAFFAMDNLQIIDYWSVENEALSSQLMIGPNPVVSQLQLQFQGEVEKICIIDLQGRVMKSIAGNQILTNRVDVSDLQAGIYLLSVQSAQKFLQTKFIKINENH